jgi:hypothetical protein
MKIPSATNYKTATVPIDITCRGKQYKGMAVPLSNTCHDGVCFELDVKLNNQHLGIIHGDEKGWQINGVNDQELVDAIGEEIMLWYE